MAESEESGLRRKRDSMDHHPEFRLVLVGKTGSGKSSSGNTILGGDVFRAAVSRLSETRQCCKKKREVFGRDVTVVDTPGLIDTLWDDETMKREISKCINMSAPGPHAILLVIKVGPFTAEEQDAVRQVDKIFGEDAWKFTIVLFTYGDRVKSDFDQVVKEAGPDLQEVLEKVGHRFQVFNNCKDEDRDQVLDLLEKVDKMVSDNEGRFYSNPTYLEVVKMLDQRESELREFYQKKLEEEIKAVESKYEKKLREAQQEVEKVKQRYHTLQTQVRQVVEHTVSTDSIEDIVKIHKQLQLN